MMNLAAWDISLCAPISPNVNWMNPSNWTKMHRLFRNTFQQVHLSAISSDIGLGLNYINNILVGSAAILTFGLWSSKISQSFSDNSGMGTFSVTTIQGKDQKLISFISAHTVVKKGTDLGVDSVYAQQQIIYEKNVCLVMQRSRIFAHVPMQYNGSTTCFKVLKKNHAIVLMIDANQSLNECFSGNQIKPFSIEWLRVQRGLEDPFITLVS